MNLAAQKRDTGKTKNLRRSGHIPAIVYNKELNIPISVEMRAFDKVFRSQGTSNIIDLDISEDESREVLVKAVQMDKRRREPQHVDFYAVTAGQTVEVSIPIEFVGTAAGVKEGGLLDAQKRDVLISILPRLIPNQIEVDVSELTIGDSIHLEDIVNLLPEEAEILDELERTLVTVVAPRVEAEPSEDEITEPELIGAESDGEEGDGESAAEDSSGDATDDT